MQLKLIVTTCPNVSVSQQIARTLVEERLAACVNIIPGVRSVYRWEGQVHDEEESILLVKTSMERIEEAQRRLKEIHPYTTPELVVISPEDVDQSYLAWALEVTKKS